MPYLKKTPSLNALLRILDSEIESRYSTINIFPLFYSLDNLQQLCPPGVPSEQDGYRTHFLSFTRNAEKGKGRR